MEYTAELAGAQEVGLGLVWGWIVGDGNDFGAGDGCVSMG